MPGLRSKITPILPKATRTPNVDANNPRQAFQSVQQAFDAIYRALTTGEIGIEELFVTGEGGRLTAWIGTRVYDNVRYSGGYFESLYVGGENGPPSAPFFADDQGNVVIGKNGSVSLRDIGDNEVGWLGTQWDADLAISGATNATPIVITTASQTWEDGDTVFIDAVTGNTAANGYRIVKNVTATTAELTDLSGANIAGNGAYAGGGTAQRYFGGGRFQTIAIGDSFEDYKLRAFANGRLKIRNANITLEGTDATIVMDPDLGVITISEMAPGTRVMTLDADGLDVTNGAGAVVSFDETGVHLIDSTYTSALEHGFMQFTAGGAEGLYAIDSFSLLYDVGSSQIEALVGVTGSFMEFRNAGGSIVTNIGSSGISTSTLSLTTALSLLDGGTGATNAGAARTNLNVYAKTDVYTKSEVDTLLAGKANIGHTHTAITVSDHTHGTQPPDGGHSHLVI